MFGSIVRAVSAHKQIVIAGVALAVLVSYASPLPYAIAQVFFPPGFPPGVPTPAGGPPELTVNTPHAYVHIFDRTLSVNTPGVNFELHFDGF
jgi:hypothetical protein